MSNFGAYRGSPGCQSSPIASSTASRRSGDAISSYSETVKAGDTTVKLTWCGLGKPFCFALPPDKSATGKHHMPSLFVGCEKATITVNGKAPPGHADPARHRRPAHLDRDAGLLRDLDPGLTALDWEAVVAHALSLPGTEPGTYFGKPTVKANGHALVSPGREAGSFVLHVAEGTQADAAGDRSTTCWQTPHYQGWPALLVRYDSPDPERVLAMIGAARDRAMGRKPPRKR